jgi:hypothetical protein
MYFAGSYTRRELDILTEYKCPIMQNWSTVEPNDPIWKKLRTGEITDVIFDSGGFQAQTGVVTRRVVNLESYALWQKLTLREYPMIKCMCLDVFGDNKKTLDNLKFFEDKGLHPIPIWHARNIDVYDKTLEYYCNNYDYIAIGGIALKNRNYTYRIFEYIMQKYPDMKFHLLGIGLSISNICKIYRPYSADASSWLAPARWGQELYLDEKKNIRLRPMSPEDKQAIRKNDDVRTEWSLKTIQRIKTFEKLMNDTTPNRPYQINMFAGEEK